MKIIKLFEDDLTEKACEGIPIRRGSRGIITHGDYVLIIYNKHWDLYTLPGGGIEPGESEEDAFKREMLEETGYTVKNIVKTVVLKEHFHDSVWEHHYFTAETDQFKGLNHTKEEVNAGMEVTEVTFDEAIELFSSHVTDHLHSDNIYQREFLGLIHSLKA